MPAQLRAHTLGSSDLPKQPLRTTLGSGEVNTSSIDELMSKPPKPPIEPRSVDDLSASQKSIKSILKKKAPSPGPMSEDESNKAGPLSGHRNTLSRDKFLK